MADMVHIRLLGSEEIAQCVDIWKEQGLEEGINTLQLWHKVDPDGFFGAIDKQTGEVVGMCCAIRQKTDLYFLGLYAVRTRLQGRGIGIQIWRAAMERVGNANAGLNAVPEHLHTYRDRAGFSLVDSWQTLVYSCPGSNLRIDTLPKNVDGVTISCNVGKYLKQVIDYDEEIHGFRREKACSITYQDDDGLFLIAHRHGQVCGFGKVSTNILGGALCAPLYGENDAIAALLLRGLIEGFPACQESFTFFGVSTECNPHCSPLVENLGLRCQMDVPRCYRFDAISAKKECIFSQHTLNFSLF